MYVARGESYKIVLLYHNMTKERHFVPIPILELWIQLLNTHGGFDGARSLMKAKRQIEGNEERLKRRCARALARWKVGRGACPNDRKNHGSGSEDESHHGMEKQGMMARLREMVKVWWVGR